MENDIVLKNGIIIPTYELEVTTSRSGGPGGQHVNKTETRITVRWNASTTKAFNDEQKTRIIENLKSVLTDDGDLIIHDNSSRSQQHNKQHALTKLKRIIEKALYIPKKRKKTKISKEKKEQRLQEKKRKSSLKKMRSKKFSEE